MRFELNRLSNYSDENLIKELIRVAKIVKNEKLSVKEFDKHSKVHSSTIRRRFGNWGNALEKAGIIEKFDNSNNSKSKVEIIEELKRVYGLIGQSFTRKEFEHHSRISSSAIYKHFKNYSKALIEAGIKPRKESLKYNDEERFENMLSVWTYRGRQPTYKEMNKEPSLITGKSYISRWGSWSKSLNAFVEKVNSDIKDKEVNNNENEEIDKTIDKKFRKRIPKSEQRDVPLGLRYDILKRDKFRCVLCGKSPATVLNCKLQVDHMIAWAKGGKTIKENLQTLCAECNNGKSDKE